MVLAMRFWMLLSMLVIGAGCQSVDHTTPVDMGFVSAVDMEMSPQDATPTSVADAMTMIDGRIQVDVAVSDLDAATDAAQLDMQMFPDVELVLDAATDAAPLDMQMFPDVELVLDAATAMDAHVVSDAGIAQADMVVTETDTSCGAEAYVDNIDGQSRCVPCRAQCAFGETEVVACTDDTDRMCE